jgi:hypothetical protein
MVSSQPSFHPAPTQTYKKILLEGYFGTDENIFVGFVVFISVFGD